jgi:hypothetical protein
LSLIEEHSTETPEEPSYPRTWFWGPDGKDEGDGQGDGEVCTGTYTGFDVASTRDFGDKGIMIVTVAGEQRSIWLLQTALEHGFRDELQRRKGKIAPNERVTVRRLPKVATKDGKRTYHPFRWFFPDRPETDPLEFLEINLGESEKTKADTTTANENGDGGDVDDDGIPF